MNTHLRDNLQYLYDRGVGIWTSVPYNAANFGVDPGGSGTWTVDAGDQVTFKYATFGKIMWVQWQLETTTLTGAAIALSIAIPGGATAVNGEMGVCYASGPTTEFCAVAVVAPRLQILRSASAPWAVATNTQSIRGQIWFEIA